MMDEYIRDTRRAREVADRRVLPNAEWTAERAAAWEVAKMRMAESVPLQQPREDREMLVFRMPAMCFGEAAFPNFLRKKSSADLQWRR